MNDTTKDNDENAKNKKWQIPVDRPYAVQEEYPERKLQRPSKPE